MSSRKQLMTIFVFVLAMVASAASVFAQERAPQPPPPPKPDGGVMIFERHIEGPGAEGGIEMVPDGMREPGDTFIFISTEMSFDRKTVKNAPYSAQAVTETVQTLGDGNRIVRKNTANVYRDSEGRLRRDQTLTSIGPWAAAGEPQQTSFITDPVTRTHYVLDPRSRTARKMLLPEPPPPQPPPTAPTQPGVAPAPREGRSGDNFTIRIMAPPGETDGRGTRLMKPIEQPKVESLGKQTIEGVEAEGTRDTITIPAGEIGNENPIKIISERWYSPELQTVILSKHSDPRMGETTFRLTNISRSEPARTLFEVPADYTIKEGPAQMRTIRRKPGDEK